MAKFEAKKLDLDLELVTLSGEQVNLEPKFIISMDTTYKIMKEWTRLDKENEGEEDLEALRLIADQLAFVYPKDTEWFMSNFDIGTISEIVGFVGQTMGGMAKKETSSS